MHRAIIVANGWMEPSPHLRSELQPGSFVIAADGGAHNCQALGVQPNVIIGDLDSLEPQQVTDYRQAGVEIIQHPTHKDETDLELALYHARSLGVSQVTILGALGKRWDMTIANLLLAAHPAFNQISIKMIDGDQEVILLPPQVETTLQGKPGETLSLIPIRGDVTGVVTRGLEYPLSGETLKFGTARGVSNVFVSDQASVFYQDGLLLCVLTRGE